MGLQMGEQMPTTDFLTFLAKLGVELYDLYQYVKRNQPDPEEEKRLAMRLVRKAVDEEARNEIEGP